VFLELVNKVKLDPMTDRAALYARQSVTRSKKGKGDVLIGGSASLDEQVRQCRDAAKRLGIDTAVDLVEKPSTSGYKQRGRSRPEFKELLEHIRIGRIDCVIPYKTDRLSRGGGPGWPRSSMPSRRRGETWTEPSPLRGAGLVSSRSAFGPPWTERSPRRSRKG
jgi:hypothetical protein